MRPNVFERRTLLIAVALPVLWIASAPLAYCICPSGRIAIVSGDRCVGCDCSCCDEHSCCRTSKLVTTEEDEKFMCSKGCRRSVVEPSFTLAANFEWSQPQPDVWIERLPSRFVPSNDARLGNIARRTILPHTELYLEHGVLLL